MVKFSKVSKKKISIIVPCYNEQEVIQQFYNRTIKVVQKLKMRYEIIFIDDGSKDKTMMILNRFSLKNKNIKILSFSRNFGHQIALSAGLDFADGDAVVLMDADLQDPPEWIPKMLERWQL